MAKRSAKEAEELEQMGDQIETLLETNEEIKI